MSPLPAEEISSTLDDGKIHLLLACTGSVATIKIPLITKALSDIKFQHPISIRIIISNSAKNFLQGQAEEQPHYSTLKSIPHVDGVYFDEDEWTAPGWTRSAKILHIELRRWTDLLVIAPLSANTLAKITNGLCDDLLSCVIRAWDVKGKGERLGGKESILVAPAMNTAMWDHPLTEKQLRVLRDEWDWFEVLVPASKALACGDVGKGAMMEWKEIVKVVDARIRVLESRAEEGKGA